MQKFKSRQQWLSQPLAAFAVTRIHLQRIRKGRDVVDSIRRIRITDDAYSIHNQTETQTVLTEWKWDSFKRFRAAEKGFCFYTAQQNLRVLAETLANGA